MFYPGKDVTYPQVTDIYYMLARKSVHEYYDFLFVALASSHGECSKDGKCNLHSKMLNQPDDIKVIYGLEKCIQCSTVPSEYEQILFNVFESNLSCRVHTARFSKSSDHCCFHTARCIGDRRFHTA